MSYEIEKTDGEILSVEIITEETKFVEASGLQSAFETVQNEQFHPTQSNLQPPETEQQQRSNPKPNRELDKSDKGSLNVPAAEICNLQTEHSYTFSKTSFTQGLSRCPHCGLLISTGRLKSHIYNLHSGKEARPYKCGYCDNMSINQSTIEEHVKTYHPGQPVLVILFKHDKDKQDDTSHPPSSEQSLQPGAPRPANPPVSDYSIIQPTANGSPNQLSADSRQYSAAESNQVSTESSSASVVGGKKTTVIRKLSAASKLSIKRPTAPIRDGELRKLLRTRQACPICKTIISSRLMHKHINKVHRPITEKRLSPTQCSSSGAVARSTPSSTVTIPPSNNQSIVSVDSSSSSNRDNNIQGVVNTNERLTQPLPTVNKQKKSVGGEEVQTQAQSKLRQSQAIREINRKVCMEKISRAHKVCGKCGFIYVKLKHHRPLCRGVVDLTARSIDIS